MFPASDSHYSNSRLRPALSGRRAPQHPAVQDLTRTSSQQSLNSQNTQSITEDSHDSLLDRQSVYGHVTNPRGSIVDDYGIRHHSRAPSPYYAAHMAAGPGPGAGTGAGVGAGAGTGAGAATLNMGNMPVGNYGSASLNSSNYSQLAHVDEKLSAARNKFDINNPNEYAHVGPEPDDEMHNAYPLMVKVEGNERVIQDPYDKEKRYCKMPGIFGCMNIAALILMTLCLFMLFAGWPILNAVQGSSFSNLGSFGIGGTNQTGQVPDIPGMRSLVDDDTPDDAMKRRGYDGHEYSLVFSDEFNVDGRTFYPGDDPFFEAVNLHYHQTNDLEWYDPDYATTRDGNLVLTMVKDNPDTLRDHNLNYTSAMLQSWNKFCFTGGYIEISASLPGDDQISGFWPAAWTMGNLARPGYGASTEGLWPYSYDSCDVGTLPNQTRPDGTPEAALTEGDPTYDGALSYLPGQRLSRCTCDGEDHPGPKHSDGSYVGRSSPEIDILEAQVAGGEGENSQSAQWAPFDANYHWDNTTANHHFNPDNGMDSHLNTYIGGALQQVTSGLSTVPSAAYTDTQNEFIIYGFEYFPGDFITWVQDDQEAWTLLQAGVGPNEESEISQRLITAEPMSIVLNFAISRNFGEVEEDELVFPAEYQIDYIRVYQRDGERNIGCSTKDYPTEQYINDHIEAYTNPNLTIWSDYNNSTFPKNRLIDEC